MFEGKMERLVEVMEQLCVISLINVRIYSHLFTVGHLAK